MSGHAVGAQPDDWRNTKTHWRETHWRETNERRAREAVAEQLDAAHAARWLLSIRVLGWVRDGEVSPPGVMGVSQRLLDDELTQRVTALLEWPHRFPLFHHPVASDGLV